jgi:opacity protein-like surface antigen
MHLDGFAYIDVKLCKEGQSLVKPAKCGTFIFRMTSTIANSFRNCADVFSFLKRIFMNSTSKFALKTTLKALAVGVLAVAAMAGAQAQSTSAAPALTGVYVGGSVGSTAITDLSSKVGYGGYVGLKLNENFAIEAGAQSLGKFSVAGADVSASAYNVSVLAGVPIDPKISIYGRLGYGSLTATAGGTTADTNSALYGVGARYNINQNLAVRAEYTRLASDTGTFGVGLQYGF